MPGGYSGLFEGTRGARREPITNADRIRAMTDEELAQMFIRWQGKGPVTLWCKDEYGCAELGEDFDCTDELQAGCIVRWLQSPAEGTK